MRNKLVEVEISEDYGDVFGYYYPSKYKYNFALNYFTNTTHLDLDYMSEILSTYQSKYKNTAVLKHIQVNEDYRNQGYGNSLMLRFLDELPNSTVLFLFAAADWPKDQTFLVKWYKSFGFKKLKQKYGGALMVLEPE